MIQPTISWLHQVLDHQGRDRMIDTIMARHHHPHLRAAISQFTCHKESAMAIYHNYWRTISLLIHHRGKYLTLLELNFPPMSSCTDTYMLDVAALAILLGFISMPIRTASTILETLTSTQMSPMYRM